MRFKAKHIKLFEQFLKNPLIVKSEKKAAYQDREDDEMEDDEEFDDLELEDDPEQDSETESDIVDEMIQYFKKRKKRP